MNIYRRVIEMQRAAGRPSSPEINALSQGARPLEGSGLRCCVNKSDVGARLFAENEKCVTGTW